MATGETRESRLRGCRMALNMVRCLTPYLSHTTKEPFNVLVNVVDELTSLMAEANPLPALRSVPDPSDDPYFHRFDPPHRADVGC